MVKLRAMKKLPACLLFWTFLLFGVFGPVRAAENEPVNNKFGIHLAVPSEQDLQAAAALVNSNGGDWGYVTVVMEENDRDLGKWQGIFDRMRELHLIPIVRLATSPEGDHWRRPSADEAQIWAEFLNSLNWVVKNRYVVLFNEPIMPPSGAGKWIRSVIRKWLIASPSR